MNCKPDVISLTETWIQPSSSGPYKNLNGYNFVSNGRNSCKGGGVAFYVKDKFHFNICDELVEMDEKNFESLFINLKMEGESFLCGTIYRSPANDAMSNEKFRIKLQNCLSKIDVKEKCYIFGDFNYDLAQTTENTHVYEFTEIMLNHSFFSVTNKPTRITDTTATVLDQLWANSFCYAVKSNILLHPISDHLPIFMCINLCMDNSSACTTVRCFNDNNMSKFYHELENIDELPILNESDVNESFTCFMKEYNRVFENCFPLTAVKNYAKNKSWFDKDLQILLQERRHCLKNILRRKLSLLKLTTTKLGTVISAL